MPFCPECGTEYRAGFDACADCGSKLVESLERPVKMVEAGRLADPGTAGMVKETLEAQGIPCALVGSEKEGMMPGMVDPSHEIRVMTPEGDMQKARDIIDAYFCNDLSCKEPEFMVCSNCECPVDDTNDVCPACGEPLEDNSQE